LENHQKEVDGQQDFDDSTCMRDESTTTNNGSETMTNVAITVDECDRSELNLILGFRGLPRGQRSVTDGRYRVETTIGYLGDFPRFAEKFASHLNPTIELS